MNGFQYDCPTLLAVGSPSPLHRRVLQKSTTFPCGPGAIPGNHPRDRYKTQ